MSVLLPPFDQKTAPRPNSTCRISARPNSMPSTSLIPQGVGAPPPPGLDPKTGKLMCIKVRMLDDSIGVFHLGHKAVGQALFEEVCRHLNLLESDYFGLSFHDDHGNHYWLDKDKAILRQVTSNRGNARFYFIVKFYTPNPVDLEEEYTRYLFAQQIRRDLATGDMICNENTAALMASYMVQADCGDFSPEDYPDHTYLSAAAFVPNQTAEFQKLIMSNHKKLIGMDPSESDLALLETARRCDFYGIKLHPAKDIEGTPVNLSVAHLGLKIFQQVQCISTFSWAKIRKLSFKRRKLLIKLHPESYQYYKETIEFSFDCRNECKNFWKKCVEHHAFFRCLDVTSPEKPRESRFFTRGSSFRYHGRTQKQLIDYVREHHKRREPFTRPLRPALGTQSLNRQSRPPTVLHPNTRRLSTEQTKTSNGFHSNNGQRSSSSGTRVNHPRPSRASHFDGDQRMCTSDLESPEVKGTPHPILPPSKPLHQTVSSTGDGTTMSLSLPNVLGDEVQVLLSRELEKNAQHPPKSSSGDNFHEPTSYDNVSHGSYHLSDHESDLTSPTSSAVYATTFTTRRIGDVIVKRVLSNAKSIPTTTDDEDDRDKKIKKDKGIGDVIVKRVLSNAKSIPTTTDDEDDRDKKIKKDKGINDKRSHQRVEVPPLIEQPLKKQSIAKQPFSTATAECQTNRPIYGTVSSTICPSPKTEDEPKPIYTASGAILRRPRVIPDSDTYGRTIPGNDTYGRTIPGNDTYGRRIGDDGYSQVKRAKDPISGPLPGKVITSDDVMITPMGLREKQTTEFQKKKKPIVPPKPKNLCKPAQPIVHMHEQIPSPAPVTFQQMSSQSSGPSSQRQEHHQQPSSQRQEHHQQPSSQRQEHQQQPPSQRQEHHQQSSSQRQEHHQQPPSQRQEHHQQSSSQRQEHHQQLEQRQEHHQQPSSQRQEHHQQLEQRQQHSLLDERPLIKIESEDRPDIQQCHLFNSEIPYVLTMRTVQTASASEQSDDNQKSALRRRRSLDLVSRKSLPGPSDFSSQDHSISPTTPDSGNIIDYLLRRRSASNERPTTINKRNRRGEPRRQTQPVRFTLPEKNENESSSMRVSRSQDELDDDHPNELDVDHPTEIDDDHPIEIANIEPSGERFPPPPPSLGYDDEDDVLLPPPPPAPSLISSRFLVTPVDLSLTLSSSPPFIDDSNSSSASKTPPHRGSLEEEQIAQDQHRNRQTTRGSLEGEQIAQDHEQMTPIVDIQSTPVVDIQSTPVVEIQSTRTTESGLLWTDF